MEWPQRRPGAAGGQAARGRTLRRALAGALAALGVGAVCLYGVRVVRFHLAPKRFVEVEPGRLYRSGELAPRLAYGVLQKHGIRKVVWMLHYDATKSSHRAERAAIEALGIEQVNLSLHGDGTGDAGRYVQALTEIHEALQAGEPVLVQCAAGSRRTGGVVSLYELLVEGHRPDEAYRELDRFGSHPVAETPLLPYLNEHMEEIARGLVEHGVIAHVPAPLPVLRPPPPVSRLAALDSFLNHPRGLAPW